MSDKSRLSFTHNEIKKAIGCPVDAVFLGVIFYFPLREEFLVLYDCRDDFENVGYSKVPHLSSVYSFSEALEIAKNIQYSSKICNLYRSETHFFVSHRLDKIVSFIPW